MEFETNNNDFQIFDNAKIVSIFKTKHKIKIFIETEDKKVMKFEIFNYEEPIHYTITKYK